MLNSSKELEIGQFVKSKAGRDKDRIFIVIEIVDEQFVKIADGDIRKLEKPKMKKIKHLIKLKFFSEDLREKIENDKKITNAMLRKEVEKTGLI
ncbi:KOW domain-containing RNA-binding protein [Fusibacter ferrireducens]|uniref:KOW domain-containing RNA-binding protein n=1 Tax=Fusibacter ferrireducens TaxID=2785058 RepID=A0ABS0A1T2_9FIRM|nr:KOW domain-containing RNA-binding protein [Fusibacter ferrireducens]MBF4695824.1 KOW domain-containing RNA-binding protein [Fusibacter ferrireducens]